MKLQNLRSLTALLSLCRCYSLDLDGCSSCVGSSKIMRWGPSTVTLLWPESEAANMGRDKVEFEQFRKQSWSRCQWICRILSILVLLKCPQTGCKILPALDLFSPMVVNEGNLTETHHDRKNKKKLFPPPTALAGSFSAGNLTPSDCYTILYLLTWEEALLNSGAYLGSCLIPSWSSCPSSSVLSSLTCLSSPRFQSGCCSQPYLERLGIESRCSIFKADDLHQAMVHAYFWVGLHIG